MTKEEKTQIDRVFPQGHDEIDVPTYIRNRSKEDIARIIHYEKQAFDKLLEGINIKRRDI